MTITAMFLNLHHANTHGNVFDPVLFMEPEVDETAFPDDAKQELLAIVREGAKMFVDEHGKVDAMFNFWIVYGGGSFGYMYKKSTWHQINVAQTPDELIAYVRNYYSTGIYAK